jgi:hypothetical protein
MTGAESQPIAVFGESRTKLTLSTSDVDKFGENDGRADRIVPRIKAIK